jgi:hypothetical protein
MKSMPVPSVASLKQAKEIKSKLQSSGQQTKSEVCTLLINDYFKHFPILFAS